MKIFKYIGMLLVLILWSSSCQDDDISIGEIKAPSNLNVAIDITGADADNPFGDGSGEVTFNAQADDAVSYSYLFNGTLEAAPSGQKVYNFSRTGTFIYDVTVIANGTGGLSTSTTVQVEVLVLYEPPIELVNLLTSAPFRIKSEANGHFGLGPVGGEVFGEFFAAPANDKAGVGMYDDRYIFNADGTFTHIVDNTNDDPTEDPSGTVFGRENLINELNGPGSGTQNGADIENYPYSDYIGSWSITAPGGVVTLNLTGIGFIGYYIGGNHSYELFGYDPQQASNDLVLRSTDGNNEFDWWFLITPGEPGGNDANEPPFENQIWADEFDTDGAPNASNWTYDLGTGQNGWGNNESQTYTDDPSNVIVENGLLKITARAENGGYTSSRLKSQGLFDFTYGRVEVRAKLPSGGGTWPAIWMLGSNFESIGWPNCGEIDIMEHVGNQQNTVFSSLHFPGNSGGDAVTEGTIDGDVSDTFHIYEVVWSPSEISFSIDGQVFHTFTNNAELPFNDDFFLILNVAMGGNFGGTIDPGFTSSTMEIDYVRVYQ
ncbi:family 16 glycosylhydrolase [Aquimarina brevivitae]|nr:family 16 glycosylhydrolase [Aquimarina brevivitae]